MVAEELIRRHGWGPARSRFAGLVVEARQGPASVLVVMPQTYMNLSGNSIGQAARFYKVAVEDILAIHDEVELPFGVVRLKRGGGLGGHNGLRSLQKALGSREFWRVRVGVGRPASPDPDLAGYVLSPFSEPAEEVRTMVAEAADAVERWLTDEEPDAQPPAEGPGAKEAGPQRASGSVA